MIVRLRSSKLSIRQQLTLWYPLILALVLLLAACAFYGALKLTLDAQVDTDLQDHAQRITTGISWKQGTIVIRDVTGTLPGLTTPVVLDGPPDAATAIWV